MISSAWRRPVEPCSRLPLTYVPLLLPRASRVQPSPSFHTRAADGAVVFETGFTVEAVDAAASAAAAAQPAWAALSQAERAAHLDRFKAEIAARADQLADAIVLETGKIRSEAKTEIQTLINRFDLVKAAIAGDLKPGAVGPGEQLRYQPLGVV